MKILIADPVAQEGIDILKLDHQVDIITKQTEEQLMAIIADYDALVVRSETKVTKNVIAKADKLKASGRAGVGIDNIDVEAATQKGIVVLNAPEGNTIAATEHTMAMMLALARNIPQAYMSMKAGKWERSKFVGVELRGKTIGILGLGRIGRGVAKRAAAMEMKILGYDPYVTEEQARVAGIKKAQLAEIFAEADFITLHLPQTPDTKGMLNKAAFAKMKPTVRIVNCARGGVVNEADLAEALNSGRIAGAAVDVFSKEPIIADNPLATAERILFTPHLGASTEEAQIGVSVDVAHGIIQVLKGKTAQTAVNMAMVSSATLDAIKPYFTLAEKMGTLAVQLLEGGIEEIQVEYNGEVGGYDLRLLTAAVIKGVLTPMTEESVNFVNAFYLAKDRGIHVREIKSEDKKEFANLITVTLGSVGNRHTVSGTLLGDRDARIVRMDEYRVDIAPKSILLICPHVNRPGMIGKVATILGQNKINIGGMQLEQMAIPGNNIMLIALEVEPGEEVLAQIAAIDGVAQPKVIIF